MLKGIPSTQGDSYQLNTTQMLKYASGTFSEHEVVYHRVDGTWGRTNYGEFGKRVNRLANALTGLGIGPGSMVGVLDWNSLRHLELYYGVPGIGATFLQLNLRLPQNDLEYVIDHSQAKWVFVDESLLPIAEAMAQNTYVTGWVVMGDKPSDQYSPKLENVYYYEDLLAAASEEYDWPVIEETTAAFAGYTTGTTGRPKGIYYSHRSVVLHAMGCVAALSVHYRDVIMPWTPMFHVMSWGYPLFALAAGAKLVLPGKFSTDNIGEVAQAMIDEGVTLANGAPAIFTPLLEHFKAAKEPVDLSRARLVAGSSEPPVALMKGFKEITGADVVHGYGASETTPVVSVNYRLKPALDGMSEDEQWDMKRMQGVPLFGVEMKIVDPAGQELPHDGKSMGELLMRGPWITESYYKLDDNADRFADGWWRSGDVAVINELGYVKLTDRIKDVIKSGGEWISSIDMENAILDNPAVAEACVIGVPDAKFDERPVAYVVARPGETVTKEIVWETLSSRFAKWQLPDQVIVVDELPRTSVGKLDKKLLRSNWEG
ncbi:long-chain-fatty-acid--CoA ligase [Brevibacterium sp. 50QC2O2]|mgnify:CR=1 FL=1|uniref:long-chain-fatty-acid--CoA ligase n=1 Tax=Brevibacterium TaxID=1696 RepID=UPI00211CA0AC|nr:MULTISPECIES: long-chain-fatty-acid--CoA ligase [unclassified Brevibacterium]MCQ9367509.1 long-chain-fatty-acid--CoA ligase [Brevibacterium sp. 91QC2O2]MCQ9385184.1 long-chain-fatty-acid--CoA ligase [Brevibacterium sp. 68QC2CO]MCQ9387807.1 long-chain-fatty-acid--CoA ligase [Brevibacterium sp. 50QC2O2]